MMPKWLILIEWSPAFFSRIPYAIHAWYEWTWVPPFSWILYGKLHGTWQFFVTLLENGLSVSLKKNGWNCDLHGLRGCHLSPLQSPSPVESAMQWQVVPDNEETILATMNLGKRKGCPAIAGHWAMLGLGRWTLGVFFDLGVFFLKVRFDHLPKKMDHENRYIPWYHIWTLFFVNFWYLERYILSQMPKANERQYKHIWKIYTLTSMFFACFRHLIALAGDEGLVETLHTFPLEENLERVQAMWCRRLAWPAHWWSWDLFLKCLHLKAHCFRGFRCWLVGCQWHFLVLPKLKLLG